MKATRLVIEKLAKLIVNYKAKLPKAKSETQFNQ